MRGRQVFPVSAFNAAGLRQLRAVQSSGGCRVCCLIRTTRIAQNNARISSKGPWEVLIGHFKRNLTITTGRQVHISLTLKNELCPVKIHPKRPESRCRE